MVKDLTTEDKHHIAEAVLAAERASDAEFAVVISRASDEYWSAAFLCGLVLGCLIALALWHLLKFNNFPLLLSIVPGICALFLAVPFLRHECLRLLPTSMLHGRAAQRAAAEYVHMVHHLPPSVPVALLYISLAERYVHIYTSRDVRELIPDAQWDAVVTTLIATVKTEGLRSAIVKATEHAAQMLAEVFPPLK